MYIDQHVRYDNRFALLESHVPSLDYSRQTVLRDQKRVDCCTIPYTNEFFMLKRLPPYLLMLYFQAFHLREEIYIFSGQVKLLGLG